MKYVYDPGLSHGKFTIGYVMKISKGDDVSYSVGSAISLNDSNGKAIPNRGVYEQISQLVNKKQKNTTKKFYQGYSFECIMWVSLKKRPL